MLFCGQLEGGAASWCFQMYVEHDESMTAAHHAGEENYALNSSRELGGALGATEDEAARVRLLLAATVQEPVTCPPAAHTADAGSAGSQPARRSWRYRLSVWWYRYKVFTLWVVLEPSEVAVTQTILWSTILVIGYRVLMRIWRFLR